jgi:hypothetical protein
VADRLRQGLALQIKMYHHLTAGREASLGAIDIVGIVPVVKDILEGNLGFLGVHSEFSFSCASSCGRIVAMSLTIPGRWRKRKSCKIVGQRL